MSEKMCKSCSHQIVCLHASRDIKGCAYYEKYEEQRPHGEWIFKHNSSDIWCSNCDENFNEIPQKFLFCPNCGASMQANDRQVTGKLDENTQKHYGFRKKY